MRYLNQRSSEIRNIFTIIYCTESILLLLKMRVVIMRFAAQNAKGVLRSPVNIAIFVVHFLSSQKDRHDDNGRYLMDRERRKRRIILATIVLIGYCDLAHRSLVLAGCVIGSLSLLLQ